MKKNCEICGNRFDQVRADQVYCSKACKQKAYRGKSPDIPEREPVNRKAFSYSEWRGMIDYFDMDTERYPFILFCFIRELAPANLTGDNLSIAMMDLAGDLDKTHTITNIKAYREFHEKFLSKEFEIVS